MVLRLGGGRGRGKGMRYKNDDEGQTTTVKIDSRLER